MLNQWDPFSNQSLRGTLCFFNSIYSRASLEGLKVRLKDLIGSQSSVHARTSKAGCE